MGTAFFSVNVVYIGKDIFTVGIAVLHCNFYDDTVLFAFQVNGFSVDFIFVVINIIYKFNDTATKVEVSVLPPSRSSLKVMVIPLLRNANSRIRIRKVS